jgi:hypothetical protein
MAWETRRTGRPYYARTRRAGGRFVREYVGTGRPADLAAADDARRRAERLAARSAWQQERARLEALDAPVAELDRLATLAVRMALEATGYHQHNRGKWRKRRDHAD